MSEDIQKKPKPWSKYLAEILLVLSLFVNFFGIIIYYSDVKLDKIAAYSSREALSARIETHISNTDIHRPYKEDISNFATRADYENLMTQMRELTQTINEMNTFLRGLKK